MKWPKFNKIWRIRVAKCKFFYTEQNCQTKFYPKKKLSRGSFGTKLKKKLTKTILLENNCSFTFQIKLVYTQKSYMLYKSSPKKSLILRAFCQSFTPICQYFYTDILIISITFCNSGKNSHCTWLSAKTNYNLKALQTSIQDFQSIPLSFSAQNNYTVIWNRPRQVHIFEKLMSQCPMSTCFKV